MAIVAISEPQRRWVALSIPAGFTLLEVLIAMVVFSVGMLALAAMSSVVIKGNDSSNRLTVATIMAEAKLGQLANTAYADLAAEAVASSAWDSRFNIEVGVTDPGPEAGTKELAVTVTWTGADGNDRTLSLSTIRGDPD